MTYHLKSMTFALLAASGAAIAQDGPAGAAARAEEMSHGAGARIVYGDSLAIGTGRYHTYVRTSAKGEPMALGVKFHKSTLRALPTEPETDGSTCFDLNGDNAIDLHEECVGGHSRTMSFSPNPTPFKSITINWEPHGHVPADVYDRPHFDFHFYMISDIERKTIFPGACPGLVNCALAAKAILPLPARYVHPDFFNTKLVYAQMGNHYADGTSPEFHGQVFTQTFILGEFGGKTTFYEPMVTLEYLMSEPDQCTPIKQPQAFADAGWYPTRYCIGYDRRSNFYDVSLAGFRYRVAG
jgi:hypothetical protein